jgi:hypothetical protein
VIINGIIKEEKKNLKFFIRCFKEKKVQDSNVVVHTYNPSTWEAEERS